MNSHVTRAFRACLRTLPEKERKAARASYRLFRLDPFAPSLRLKEVSPANQIWSARVSLGYRALGVRTEGAIVWFWIGDHEKYEQLIKKSNKS